MEHPDDHLFEVMATITERLQEYTLPREKASKLARQTLLLIQQMQTERLSFDKGYAALCASIQMLHVTEKEISELQKLINEHRG